MDVCIKHGPFNMIIDDGGHTSQMIQTALRALFPHDACMTKPSWYVIEDMHTMAMCNQGYCKDPADIHGIISNAFYHMHSHWFTSGATPSKIFKDLVPEIRLFDSMAFIKRDVTKPLTRVMRGPDSFSNPEREVNAKNAYNSIAAPISEFVRN